jgi:hypothetical protein
MILSLNRLGAQCARQGIAHLPTIPLLLPTFLRALPKSFSTDAKLREEIALKQKTLMTLEQRLAYPPKDRKSKNEWNNAKSLSESIKASIAALNSQIKTPENPKADPEKVIEKLIFNIVEPPAVKKILREGICTFTVFPPSLDSLQLAHQHIEALPLSKQNQWRFKLLDQMIVNRLGMQAHNFVKAVISSLASQQDKDVFIAKIMNAFKPISFPMISTLLPLASGALRIQIMGLVLEYVSWKPIDNYEESKVLWALLSGQERGQVMKSLSWTAWFYAQSLG